MKPEVSVVMPVYNAEQYLNEVLEAMDAQTCRAMEVIAVDDGSRDSSGCILDEYAKTHPWLRVIHRENGGIYQARETGIQAAAGRYIGFCDNDDLPLPELYQRLYEAAERENADLVACSFVREEMETGRTLSHEMLAMAGMTVNLDEDPAAMAVINPAPWNKLYRAEILKKGIQFDQPPRVLEDVILNASVFPLMHKAVVIPDMLYRYRIRSNSTILTIRKEDLPQLEECMRMVRERVCETAGKQSESMLRMIDSMAFIHFGTSVVLRRIQKGDSIHEAVRDARVYLDRFFPYYGKPAYGIVWNVRHKGIMLKPLIALRCFQLHLMGPLFTAYRFVTEKLHMEIKW